MEKGCTIYRTAEFVGKKWTILVLLELYKGDQPLKRFSVLKKSLMNITSKMLSERLSELEREGLVVKKVDASVFPIKSEYALTKSGKEFIKVIDELKKWAILNNHGNKLCGKTECKYCTEE